MITTRSAKTCRTGARKRTMRKRSAHCCVCPARRHLHGRRMHIRMRGRAGEDFLAAVRRGEGGGADEIHQRVQGEDRAPVARQVQHVPSDVRAHGTHHGRQRRCDSVEHARVASRDVLEGAHVPSRVERVQALHRGQQDGGDDGGHPRGSLEGQVRQRRTADCGPDRCHALEPLPHAGQVGASALQHRVRRVPGHKTHDGAANVGDDGDQGGLGDVQAARPREEGRKPRVVHVQRPIAGGVGRRGCPEGLVAQQRPPRNRRALFLATVYLARGARRLAVRQEGHGSTIVVVRHRRQRLYRLHLLRGGVVAAQRDPQRQPEQA
mmetsp:Transcript_8736/g.32922  ORF Transcript_8736/g.32922 Transcript_8736/m.32922 type:complete len:322 (+) Transcript_8736:1967-2932(+)